MPAATGKNSAVANMRTESLVMGEEYVFLDYERSRRVERDPWVRPEPNLAKSCTLSYMLTRPFLSIMAAHILAHDKTTTVGQEVRYQDKYKRCGRAHIYDVECNGVLYRHHDGRIYSKTVGN